MNWVYAFDTNNINDCFDNSFNRTPSQLLNFEKQVQDDMRRMNYQMKLSPNNSRLNEIVKL